MLLLLFLVSLLPAEAREHHLSSLYLSRSCLLSPGLLIVFAIGLEMAGLAECNKLGPRIHFVKVWMMGLDDNFLRFALLSDILFAALLAARLTGVVGTFETGWTTLLEIWMVFTPINISPSLFRVNDHCVISLSNVFALLEESVSSLFQLI